MKNKETWKIINEYSDYLISDFGKIKSLKFNKEKILKLCTDSHGYFQISLYRNDHGKSKKIHILVYETFYNDKLKQDECVHHKDENIKNNYWKNLEKKTKSDHNSLHKINNKNTIGRKLSDRHKQKISEHMKGENNPNFGKHRSDITKQRISESLNGKFIGENNTNHKLVIKQIIQIKMLLKLKFKNKDISKIYNIDQSTISNIKNGRSWYNVI